MTIDREAALEVNMMEQLERISIFTLSRVGHLMSKRANRELIQSGFNLQIEQLPILFASYLAGVELPSQQEIANMLQKDKSGIQRSVRTLERDGYLRVVDDEVDRRKNRVQLTPAGKLVVEKVIQTAEQIDKQVTDHLAAGELAAFMTTLRKISSLLDK
jgi:DNA-binding MarR family transcriptional regulator